MPDPPTVRAVHHQDVSSPASGTCPRSTLSLRNGDVHLYVPDDEQLRRLADLAAHPGNVLPRDQEHFVSWLAGREPSDIRRRLITTTTRRRDLKAGLGWTVDFAVEVNETIVGMQSLAGFDRWPALRNVGTSSWLVRNAQRRGIGTRARCAVLDLAFGRLDAAAAFSWALPANTASTAISTRLGYRLVQAADPSDPEAETKYRLDVETWQRARPTALPQTVILGENSLVNQLDS